MAAETNHHVILVDQKQEFLDKSVNIIQSSLKRVVKKKFDKDQQGGEKYFSDVQARIKTSLDINEAVKASDLVIEAIIENLDVKQKLFKQIDQVAPKFVRHVSSRTRDEPSSSRHTIFTSNTSSLPITDIARDVQRQDRFGGLHFFNPV